MLPINDAIDVFIDSYACTRSMTRPVEVAAIGCLRVVRDIPRGRDELRNSEVIAYPSVSIDRTLADLGGYKSPVKLFVSIFVEEKSLGAGVVGTMKRSGYRLMRTEPLMVIPTSIGASTRRRHEVKRVQTEADAVRVTKFSRMKVLQSRDLNSERPAIRAYFVEKNGEIVAWSRSILVNSNGSYIGGLYTAREWRRQGIATDILSAMLTDDASLGAQYSTLLASKAGEQVYTKFGFQALAMLYIFNPPKAINPEV